MPTKRTTTPAAQAIVVKQWTSGDEIERAVKKLQKRIADVEALDVYAAVLNDTEEESALASEIRANVLEMFGENSPEYREFKNLSFSPGVFTIGESRSSMASKYAASKPGVITKVRGLVKRLQEKAEDFAPPAGPTPSELLDRLNLHPRISDVATDLFEDGHHWEAVFAASKALVNYVKERSGRHDLDGAPLMRQVFSRNNPILAFNDLATQSELDVQEGTMHLFEGVAQAIRNPGAHDFPEGDLQRAVEYLSLISMLAYRTQEAKKRKATS